MFLLKPMPANRHNGASFIVRIWWEQDQHQEPAWRGQVVHAPTNRIAGFEDIEALVTFFERWVGRLSTEPSEHVLENGPASDRA